MPQSDHWNRSSGHSALNADARQTSGAEAVESAAPIDASSDTVGDDESERGQNPYAVSPLARPAKPDWNDGEIVFTYDEIWIRGDTELPRLCINTGQDNDLVQRQHTLRAHSPEAGWFLKLSYWPLLVAPYFAMSEVLPLDSDFAVLFFPVMPIACFILLFIDFRTARKAQVIWYIRRQDTLTGSGWRILGLTVGLLLAMGLLAVVSMISSPMWKLIVQLAGLAFLFILMHPLTETTLKAYATPDGLIWLRGHSGDFVRAWAAQLEDSQDSSGGSDSSNREETSD